ncbi:hypothetical protein BKP35_09015 [Anaerobacillus arseniciselenatis]|uniref:Uncharacterized protein n=1 Tax=Anaerobacillus arseniciselenatis TaxID=85682 RepID=A0A1S2LPL8_9BACI|nr:hypothetical protein [Anaerobacillus arseniciselenatis]OIJ13365.1 hypothetical protein BKP35_09015 [Anaerobacillus arseniciselenatis]
MLSAKLHNGKIVSSLEYNEEIHGSRIFCMDKNCNSPLIFLQGNEVRAAHFKTSGKGESKHQSECGFYQPLDLVQSISKVKEYQQNGVLDEMKETIIRLSMGRIDPDKETSTVESEKGKKDKDAVKVKNDTLTPQSISSVKGVVKLLTEFEPDVLSSILINVGGGRKVPISDLIIDQEQAHKMLWNDEMLKNVGYFVYGKVANMVKREKVMYINFEENVVPFTIVIFQQHWKDFSYNEKQLIGKDILVYGHLRKNDYQDKQMTEIIIKSDKYLENFKRK